MAFGSPAYHALKIISGCATVGLALTALVIAPGLGRAAKPFLRYLQDKDRREWRKERQKLQAAIERLRKHRLVRYIERGGETHILITQEGKSTLRKFDIEYLIIQKPEKWDGKWRMALFDIPEEYRQGRNALREKLSELGFHSLQKSAFVFPYECRDEIDFVANFFDVEKYIQYVICEDLGYNEAKMREHFGLLKQRSAIKFSR